jgi:TolA-binding protein
MLKKVLCVALALVLAAGVAALLLPSSVQADERGPMTSSDKMIKLIEEMEGFEAIPYWDYGQWTVGYGTRCPKDMVDYYKANGISEADAENLLKEFLKNYNEDVNEFADKYNLTMTQQQFDALQREIIDTEQSLRDYQRQLEEVSDSSDDLDESLNDTADGADDADYSMKSLNKTAEKTEGSFSIAKGAVATFVGNALTSLVDTAVDAVQTVGELSDSTMEFRENLAKLQTTAETAGYSTEYASGAFSEMYGILGDETAATTTISNFMKLETSTDNLNNLLNSATGIWAVYGDSIPLDGLAESVNETAKVGQITGNAFNLNVRYAVRSKYAFGGFLRGYSAA